MSKKPWTCSRVRFQPVSRYSAITMLAIGCASGVLAQPSSSSWNTTILFSGSGNLDMSTFGPGNTALDPLTVSLFGTGLTTANSAVGGFSISSLFNVIANVTVPPDPGYLPGVTFSITQPHTGLDPGLNLATGFHATGNPSTPPFYNLFPPPAGTTYGGTVSNAPNQTFGFNLDGSDGTYTLNFNGLADLTLVDAPTFSQVGNTFTFSYDNSILELNPNVGGNDPPVDFTGTVDITTTAGSAATAAPDTSPGVAGILALLAVCLAGAWQRTRTA